MKTVIYYCTLPDDAVILSEKEAKSGVNSEPFHFFCLNASFGVTYMVLEQELWTGTRAIFVKSVPKTTFLCILIKIFIIAFKIGSF